MFNKPGPLSVEVDFISRHPMLPPSSAKSTIMLDQELDTCFHKAMLNYSVDIHVFPLDFTNIRQAQQADLATLAPLTRDRFAYREYSGTQLVCLQGSNDQWRIVTPSALINNTIEWYHILLAHCGITRMLATIGIHLFFPNMKRHIEAFVQTCDVCQRHKQPGQPYGHLPPRNDMAVPWEEVAVDLVGPWKISLPNIGELRFHTLTIIDTTTTISEYVRINNNTSQHVAMHFENQWLSRYPCPLCVIYDPGTEFTGIPFQSMLNINGIQPVPTTTKNPQAKAVCERMHSTVGNMLRTVLSTHPQGDVADAYESVDSTLVSAQYAICAAIHRTLQISPCALVFKRDMLLPIPIIADYNNLRHRRQTLIDDNNRRKNLCRRFHDYEPGDHEILKIVYNPATLQERAIGPFVVQQVHGNGTLTILRTNDIYECINIRRVKPYRR
jgi:transposase InsO family protein